MDERSEDHPPETSGSDEERGETSTGDGDGLVEEDVLEEGLRESEGGEEFPGRGAEFLTEVLSKKEEPAAGDGETDSGEEKDEGKVAGQSFALPEFVNVLDGWKGASPEQSADQRGKKRSTEERHGGVFNSKA